MSANGTQNANHDVDQKLELNDCKAVVRTVKSKNRSLKRKLGRERKMRKNLEEEIKTIKDEADERDKEMKERLGLLEDDNARLAAAPKKYKRILVIEDSSGNEKMFCVAFVNKLL